MIRKLLIIAPVVLALTVVSLFMPAQRVTIDSIGRLSFETAVNLSVGQEVAYAAPKNAYTYIIPNGVGAETGLQVFPPKLQTGGSKENWLATSHPHKDVPVGEYTYDDKGTPISVNPNAGKIYIDSVTGSLIITAGALSEKCKYDIEVTSYTTYGGETVWGDEEQKYLVNELRARFQDYVYGSGSDLYTLENVPQKYDARDLPVKMVRVYAYVRGEEGATKASAETRILTNTKKYNGATISLTESEQRIVTEYVTNPQTGKSWTWDEVDTLEAGITLKDGICSFVYVEVETEVHSQTFYPIDPVEVTVDQASAWRDVDVSSYVPPGATGVVLHIVHAATGYHAFGLRKNGSSDNRITDTLWDMSHWWAAIGVDANRIFEAYSENLTAIDIYLVGYTMSGVTFFTNAYDKSLTGTGAWTDIDCATEAPGAIGLIFEVNSTTASATGLRKNGSSDNRITNANRHACFGVIIGCDTSQICEGYIGDVAVDFFLVGYITDGCTFNINATNVSLGSTDSWIDLTALPTDAVMGFIEVSTTSVANYGLRKNGSAEEIYLDAKNHHWAFVECDASYIIEGKIAHTSVDFWLVGYATVPPPPAPWLNCWAKRVKLTVDQNDITAALSNFPILLYISASSGKNSDDISFVFDELQSDDNKKKIAVTESDGTTECFVEIEKWDDANEEAWLWVKVPDISSSVDTELYLYYDKTHADNDNVGDCADGSVATHHVWDEDGANKYFKMVQHMVDDNGNVDDSTENNIDGTKTGADEPAETDGKIYKGQEFDGSDDAINLGTFDIIGDKLTISMWYDVDFVGSYDRFISKAYGTSEGHHWVMLSRYDTDLRVRLKLDGTTVTLRSDSGFFTLPTGLHHLAVVYTGSEVIYYRDGVAYGSSDAASGTLSTDSSIYWLIGCNPDISGNPASDPIRGMLDEVRISQTARTAAWISASYETAIDDLLDFGTEETLTLDISNTPASHDFQTVSESLTYTTGLTNFAVTNNSGRAIDISIQGTDMTGGITWTLSDSCTPGSDTYGLMAGLEGGDYTIIVRKTPSYNNLVENLADSATQNWGLELWTPTSFSDGVAKSGTVTLTAICT